MGLKQMFEDQKVFNKQIFDPKLSDSLVPRIKDLSIGMVEEVMEFLRTYDYKPHRRHVGQLQNVAHSHEELIDMLKYWLSLAEVVGLDMDTVDELYFAKSRVVRYRYQEEWVNEINGPCVIVDIDGVLANYCDAMSSFLMGRLIVTDDKKLIGQIRQLRHNQAYIDHMTLGIPLEGWRRLKHEFRISGAKRTMPMYPDAPAFLNWCRAQGYTIILVTSRPVDEYPNLFTDTMTWLTDNHLQFDYLWWATDKAQRVEAANVLQWCKFAVDDDDKFVQQFDRKGVRCYWLRRHGDSIADPAVVHTLLDVMEKETQHA